MRKATLLSALALAATLASPAVAEDKIGFIYVGPAADAGYNTSMDDGRQILEKTVPASPRPPSNLSLRRRRSSG